MAKPIVTQLKKEAPFDTDLHVTDKVSVRASTESPRSGYEKNLVQVLSAGVEYAKKSATFVEKTEKDFIKIKELTNNLALEQRYHALENELQDVYVNNQDDAVKCTEGWDAVIKAAKKDKKFLELAGNADKIGNYADNILNKYRFELNKKTLQKRNNELYLLCENEIKTRQNNLLIAFNGILSEDEEVRKNGFINYCTVVSEIGELMGRKNFTGGDVFGLGKKLEIAEINKQILAQGYAKGKFASLGNITEKVNFIREIENGEHKVNLKDFLNIPDELIKEAGAGDDFGDFDFSSVREEARFRIANRLHQKLNEEIQQLKTINLTRYAEEAAAGVFPKNPEEKTYRRAVVAKYDELFNNEIAAIFASKDPRKYAQILKINQDFTNTYRYVPKRLTDSIQTVMISGDPALFQAACAAVSDLLDPQKDERLVFEDKGFFQEGGFALFGMSLMRNGMPAQLAFDAVRNAANADVQTRARRDQQFKASVKDGTLDLDTFVDKIFPKKELGWWESKGKSDEEKEQLQKERRGVIPNNQIRELLKQQLLEIARGFYENIGNMDAALKASAVFLGQKWGISQINGRKQITPYPIERYYCNDHCGIDVLKAKISDNLALLNSIYRTNYKPDEIELRPDMGTYREIERGENPSYLVVFKDEFNEFVANIRGDVIRWGEEDFVTKEDERANGTGHVKAVERQLDTVREVSERQRNTSAFKNYMQRYTLEGEQVNADRE